MSPEELIRRSGDLTAPRAAMLAGFEYLETYPDGPAAADMRTTLDILRALKATAVAIGNDMPTWMVDASPRVLEHFARPVPDILCNGLVVSSRIRDADKREKARTLIRGLADVQADVVSLLFDAARTEAEALLVGGKTRSELDGVTLREAEEEADVYYRAEMAGDLRGARRGFERMRDVNPYDPYPREHLGAIAEMEGRGTDALRECLWSMHLNPGHPNAVSNAMRVLLRLGLHPLAFEIGKHYERCGRARESPVADRDIVALFRWACPTVRYLASSMAQVTASDLSNGLDMLDSLEPGTRPWLTEPHPISASVLDEARVFLSYRRADAADHADQLERALKMRYPRMRVFRDAVSLTGGERFADRIVEEIDSSNVVIVLIGESWSTPVGRARLHDARDVLRLELARAIDRGRFLLPVLLEDAAYLSASDLPMELRPIASLHAARLRFSLFDHDVVRLLGALMDVLERAQQY